MRRFAVIPVKPLDAGKSRLRLEATARRMVNEGLLRRTLDVSQEVLGAGNTIVVSADPEVLAEARRRGMIAVEEAGVGLNAAVSQGMAVAASAGATAALVLPVDLVLLDTGTLAEALHQAPEQGVLLVPDAHGDGTNMLHQSPVTLDGFHFGPGSSKRHAAEARRQGFNVVVSGLSPLSFDLDGPSIPAPFGRSPDGEGVRIIPLVGLPLFGADDDLAAAIGDVLVAGRQELIEGDVVVVAQKVVSKAEGRFAPLAHVTPSAAATDLARKTHKDPAVVELVLAESSEIMRATPGVVIARHRLGHVAANAGIDASNVGPEADNTVLLWPLDPDDSARRLRQALEARFGVRLAVVVSDSLGRAWRMGTVGTAIGVSGLAPLLDRRGENDLFGRELQATIIGVADEVAAAASMVIGEASEGIPVAIVRGVTYTRSEEAAVSDMFRPLDQDLFR